MKQSWFRKFLFVLLGLSAVIAAVTWFLPYDWAPDPGARFKIAATQVKRDRSFYWITVHLKKAGEASHDLMKPVRLVTATSHEIEPAYIDFAGAENTGTDEIWFRFWVEDTQAAGPLHLKMNDGTLTVKSSSDMPPIGDAMMRTFTTHRW